MTTRTVVWRGHPHAPAPLAAIRAARASGAARVVDDAGRELAFGALRGLWEGVRVAWQRLHLFLLRGDVFVHAARRAPDAEPAQGGDANGPVVVVLPVLPDLSHTFVYRELLAVLEARPNWRVVVLQRNQQAPQHAEARRLLDRVAFLPREGITRTYWRCVFGLWFSRRVRQLFGMYRMQADPASRELIEKLTLRDPRHPGNAFLLAATLRSMRPRHVHVYASTWPANVAMGAAFLLDVPFSISSYVDFEFPYSHKLLDQKVARATFFRVVTKFCRDRLQDLHPELDDARVPVVYLGLDLDNWREHAHLTGNGVLVSAARIVAKKGLHLMPPALAALRRRGVPFAWRVLGDGDQLPEIERLCQQHGITDAVELLGPRDSDAVREALRHADVAVLPCVVAADGERDGIPIFFLEAMALGVPVVTTPISGIPELVRDDDTGFLCPPNDVDALADRLEAVLTDTANARAVGERGRRAVHEHLDVRESARQLIEHIER